MAEKDTRTKELSFGNVFSPNDLRKRGEGETSLMIDRHTNLLIAVCAAIDAAIERNDKFEAEQGFAPMTGVEISGVMANAVISTLQERGVTLGRFLEDLSASAPDQGFTL